MKFVVAILIAINLFHCDGSSETTRCFTVGCAQTATVKDITGLDGCGPVLELADGTTVIPERRTYIQPPAEAEDPLYHFTLKAGDRVQLSFEESSALSACMAGKMVFVTCIKLLASDSKE